jgi:hypothetical protein
VPLRFGCRVALSIGRPPCRLEGRADRAYLPWARMGLSDPLRLRVICCWSGTLWKDRGLEEKRQAQGRSVGFAAGQALFDPDTTDGVVGLTGWATLRGGTRR